MQAYVTAAARISRLAVGDPTTTPELVTYGTPRNVSQATTREGLPAGTRGGLLVEHVFPLNADYEFRIEQSGISIFGLRAVGVDDAVEITIDGRRVQLVSPATSDPVRLRVTAGPHVVGVAVVRRAHVRGVDDLFSELASSAGVASLTLNGPLDPTGPGDTPSRRRIFLCHPQTSTSAHTG